MTATVMRAGLPRRHVSWRGLMWVAWRQHRAALISSAVLLAGLGGLLVISGLQIHWAYDRIGLASCGSLNGPACQTRLSVFTREYGSWPQLLPEFLWYLPLVLGVFLGAPLLARELDTGSFRFVWTQGTSRMRLLLVKLVVLGAALSALTVAFTVLFDWWYRPWLPIFGRMGGMAYDLSGSVLAAQTLLAFTLGVLIGALTHRPITAIAVAALAWLAVVIATAVFVRPTLQTPITARADSNTITMHAIPINRWVTDPHGIRLTSAQTDRIDINAGPDLNRTGESFSTWLRQHGYTSWVSYQPETRYWRFQSIETAGYAAASAALALGALMYVRRKGWT